MKCHVCKTNDAHVHVIDVSGPDESTDSGYAYQEQDICDECAARMDLPSVPTKAVFGSEIWKLLESAKRRHDSGGVTCPHCGMTLAEFRAKGRLGCPHDYEVFREHLDPLLQRIHNASAHVGRIPGGEITKPVEQIQGELPLGPPETGPVPGAPTSDVVEAVIDTAELAAALEEAGENDLAQQYLASELTPNAELTEAMLRRQALKTQLSEAVKGEDYERAAELRDSLLTLCDEIKSIVQTVAEPPAGA